MMVFPIQSRMDEDACYNYLVDVLHPQGLQCPQGHLLPVGQAAHDKHRAPPSPAPALGGDERIHVCTRQLSGRLQMKTVTFTVVILANRQLHLVVPEEIPPGPAEVIVTSPEATEMPSLTAGDLLRTGRLRC